MKRINSKQTGQGLLSPMQGAASTGMVLVWVVVTSIVYFIGLHIYIVLMIMVILGGVIGITFFGLIIDKTRFDRVITYYKYRLRVRRGKSTIHTFVLPLKKLKKHIPIEHIHEDGLIEYTKRQYGVLFRYDPPNVAKSELGAFHSQIEHIANSFAPGTEASFHFYNMIDRTNPLADNILAAINVEGKTLEQKKHLHGLYEEATKNAEPTVSTEYLLSVKLGKFKNLEHATIAYKSSIPGIVKSLRERGIYAVQVIGENEIAIEFKKFAVMERY
jgi:hypothetical protein